MGGLISRIISYLAAILGQFSPHGQLHLNVGKEAEYPVGLIYFSFGVIMERGHGFYIVFADLVLGLMSVPGWTLPIGVHCTIMIRRSSSSPPYVF